MLILKICIFVKFYFVFFLVIVIRTLEDIDDNNIITMRNQVTVRNSTKIVAMHEKAGMKVAEICQLFSQYSTA